MTNTTNSKQTDLLGQAIKPNDSEVASEIDSNANVDVSSSATNSSSSADSNANDITKNEVSKKPISKKFHQEEFTAPSGRKYLMSFPGIARASRLQSESNNGLISLHQMFMREILEGKYDYKYFDELDDDVSRSSEVTITDEDGTEETFHIKFSSYRQLDDVLDKSFDANGNPNIYDFAQYIFDNLIEEDVNFAYFDEHNGFSEIEDTTFTLITELQTKSEFGFVINKVQDFMNRMFR